MTKNIGFFSKNFNSIYFDFDFLATQQQFWPQISIYDAYIYTNTKIVDQECARTHTNKTTTIPEKKTRSQLAQHTTNI